MVERSSPSSYFTNSENEKELLLLSENFQRQFHYLYPHRPTPPLYLENECKTKKLISTFLCPSRVTKPTELVRWKDCAYFVSDFFEYDPLEFPKECPKQLSPIDAILRKRRGNSLELSTVLCTLLLSSGYDAYVVQGYSTRDVTEKMERHKEDPSLTLPPKFQHYEPVFQERLDSSYVARRKSKYYIDFEKTKRFWMEGEVEEKPEQLMEHIVLKEEDDDDLFGKRVHFWVLLLVSDTDEPQSVFLEATTGEAISLENSKYLGVEFVWNDKNFWNNSQEVTSSCKSISFEFKDINKWDAFLPEYRVHGTEETFGKKQIRMPDTWVRDVEVTDEELNNRFHPAGKHVRYETVQIDKYNPGTLEDGLELRVIYYDTKEQDRALKDHAFYSAREDFLEYRTIDFKEGTVKEMFALGRKDALKEYTYHLHGDPSFLKKMEFYFHLREDGLSSKEWIETKVTDSYANRLDYLCKREVVYKTQLPFMSNKNIFSGGEFTTQTKTKKDNNQKLTSEKHCQDKTELEEGGNVLTDDTKWYIIPAAFDNVGPILEKADISSWSFHNFLDCLDPAERYATSESESEDKEQSQGGKVEEITPEGSTENLEIKAKAGSDKYGSKQNWETASEKKGMAKEKDKTSDEEGGTREYNDRRSENTEEDSDDGEDLTTEGSEEDRTTEKEGEDLGIYDDINFDELSDEELEIDYQIYLKKLWEKYYDSKHTDLFYMDEEFKTRKDMQKESILRKKKSIIRKRRTNIRFIQRKETGIPLVRTYKRKSDEEWEQRRGLHANALITHLNLKEKLSITNVSNTSEFHEIKDLEHKYIDDANEEIIQVEGIALLDNRLRKFSAEKPDGKRILYIKQSYSKDPSIPLENSIKNIWFLFDTKSYRIDFHQPEERCSSRTLLFIKPKSETTEFSFSDYLCRQIIPSYETSKVSRLRQYSYLVDLIRKEPLVLEEFLKSEEEMTELLTERVKRAL